MNTIIRTLLALLLAFCLALPALAAPLVVGKVVAVRGNATIERSGSTYQARVKSAIEANDAFRTGAASRAKLLFVDDSVLTLGENTRMSIREFIHEKGKTGKSVFNLIDGKMRSVVGKTRFEVQTPTAVAAARGTIIYFEVGKFKNQDFTKVLCLEGKVDVKSFNKAIPGTVTLTPGKMVVVTFNKPLPPAVQAPQADLNKARQSTSDNAPSDKPADTAGNKDSGALTGSDKLSSDKPVVVDPPVIPVIPNGLFIPKIETLQQPRNVKIRIDTPK